MGNKEDKNRKLFGDITSTAVVAILFCVILLLVVFSAVSYQHAAEVQASNDNTRAVLSYVITAVKSDEAANITLTEKEGVTVLMIEGGRAGYARQIFGRDGKVYEVYGKTGASLQSGEAIEIGHSELFAMSMENEELLAVRTDLGSAYVRIGGAV